jgi:membrane protein DedA with SNARE-associated domain
LGTAGIIFAPCAQDGRVARPLTRGNRPKLFGRATSRYGPSRVLHDLITRFGLPAVFVGSGVEGEPFALAGGLLAHRTIVPLWAAMLAAVSGAFAIDLFWFTLGRRYRDHRWVQACRRRPGFARSLATIERHSVLAVPLFRFAYGLRAIAPVAVGTSAITTRRFLLLSFAAAIVWGIGFTAIGYCFGAAVGAYAGDFAILGALIGVALLIGSIAKALRDRN